ncbi:MAG: hypothetical protein HY260_09495 [Chloroflexi bacterium]|nr:hypothetical protein [Chloroflexota bacterium]
MIESPDGRRQRFQAVLNTLALDDTVLIARGDSSAAQSWLTVETQPAPTPPGPIPPPGPRPGPVTATTWDKVAEYATDRPLAQLRLRATTPAATLMTLAQPIGADTISLSVSVSGNLKGGGLMNFFANDVKPNHPTRPLTTAQTVFTALIDGATYEAELTLGFSPPRPGLAGQLDPDTRTVAWPNGADFAPDFLFQMEPEDIPAEAAHA